MVRLSQVSRCTQIGSLSGLRDWTGLGSILGAYE
jgi:hypothetical protein